VGDDFSSPKTWAKANPAYGIRISHEACADDRAAMDDEQFARERLGIWDTKAATAVFGPGKWEAVPKVLGSMSAAGVKMGALGVAVSIDLEKAAIVAAAPGEDRSTLRVMQHGPTPDDWLVARVVELQAAHGVPVVIDGKGPGS